MNSQLTASIAIILATYVVSLILTYIVRRALIAEEVIDRPNARSSHKVPVPRGGGWALILVLVPGMITAGLVEHNLRVNLGLIGGTVLLTLVSWIDDRKGAGIGLRLSMHLLAACLGSLAFSSDQMLLGGLMPYWLDRTLMIIGWAWFINLYNFMDGIDGLTSVETICVATGTCLLLAAGNINDPFADTLQLLLTGAALGFLVFNWHPAKIFLGDAGSVPLGYLTAFLLITLAVHGLWIPAIILPLYYIADSGITLLKRAARREKIWQAHREHYYQRAAQRVRRHDRVVVWVVYANIALMTAALLAVYMPVAGLAAALAIVGLLLLKMRHS